MWLVNSRVLGSGEHFVGTDVRETGGGASPCGFQKTRRSWMIGLSW